MATGSMDGTRSRPRCAWAQPRSRSDGRQQRGGPATGPTPTGAAEPASPMPAATRPARREHHDAQSREAGERTSVTMK